MRTFDLPVVLTCRACSGPVPVTVSSIKGLMGRQQLYSVGLSHRPLHGGPISGGVLSDDGKERRRSRVLLRGHVILLSRASSESWLENLNGHQLEQILF